MQLAETCAPLEVKYRPAAQGVHALRPVEAAYNPAAQALHFVFPVVPLYWPTAHAVQASPRPEAGEKVPTGHPMQLAESEAPVVVK
jgi:hypothetical protein